MDFTKLSDEELAELQDHAGQELGRRQTAAAFDDELNAVLLRGVESGLIEDKGHGEEWVQPLGSHDIYLKGAEVTHNGRLWRSLIPNNVTIPGNPDDPQAYRWWTDITDEPVESDPGDAPGEDQDEDTGDQLPPWNGEGHDYQVGDIFTYQGNPYRVLQAHQSQPHWTPDTAHSLYEKGTVVGDS